MNEDKTYIIDYAYKKKILNHLNLSKLKSDYCSYVSTSIGGLYAFIYIISIFLHYFMITDHYLLLACYFTSL